MLRRMFQACAILAGIMIAGCGGAISSADSGTPASPPPRTPLPAPTPVGLETPAAGSIYLGAYAFATKSAQDIITLESQIGRKLAMDMHYYIWTGNFPGPPENADITSSRIPIESWNCELTNAQIVAGAGDLLIATRALAVKNFGHPVFIRYLWDMNQPTGTLGRGPCYDPATDNPDGTFSSSEFILAWQHIRQIFAQEKVTNAVWVWNIAAAGANPSPYYPGDASVDWVGIDAYDLTGAGFAQTIAPIYNIAASFHKPILIAETGELAASQPVFLQSAVPALKTQFPLVAGLVYYDAKSTQNWILSSSTGGVAAFATLGSDPYVSAFGSL